jgi:hypothetical protein
MNNNTNKYLEELKIYRRNHSLLDSQTSILRKLPSYLLYNGYDFIKCKLPNVILAEDTSVVANLALSVSTRELQVSHKVKLSKAARKTNSKLKKRSSLMTKSSTKTTLVKKKPSLSKKIKK